uniref:F-box domain-containing protein n=1 Tax=Mycena chlorophos TaxID=658473 RepID=A0ABQ0LUF0_MYCCL|nr:predicted protein [Mycena chlorophos]
MVQLPTELIALICSQSNDHPTIASLCRVSRRFVAPAQEHLFRTVDLEGKTLRILRAWCSTVARHHVLAERVHSLSLQLPVTVAFMPEDAEKLSKALRACRNLKELHISSEKSGQADSVNGWLLSNVPFRLTKFADTYFSPEYYLEETLAQQTEIQVLALPFGVSLPENTLPAGRLPNLIAMSASLDAIPIDRPLERIEMPYERQLPKIVRFSGTLTTLSIIVPRHLTTHPKYIMDALLPAIPTLKHLAVVLVDATRLRVGRQMVPSTSTSKTKSTSQSSPCSGILRCSTYIHAL